MLLFIIYNQNEHEIKMLSSCITYERLQQYLIYFLFPNKTKSYFN